MYSVLIIYVAIIAIHKIILLYLPSQFCHKIIYCNNYVQLQLLQYTELLLYPILNFYHTCSMYVWYYLRYTMTDTGHRHRRQRRRRFKSLTSSSSPSPCYVSQSSLSGAPKLTTNNTSLYQHLPLLLRCRRRRLPLSSPSPGLLFL